MKNMRAKKKQIFFTLRTIILNLTYSVGKMFNLNKDTLSILCFHSISDHADRYSIDRDTFTKLIAKIAQNASFISISDAINMLEGAKIKKPAVVLTIDDGYADVLKILPVVKKYEIPVTVFVLSRPQNANRKELEHYGKLLTSKQLKYLQAQGWTIGCHSATHADFSNLSKSQIKKEIVDSKKELENKLGATIDYFAYPKGVFNNEIIKAVKNAGYKAAFAVSPNCVNSVSNKWYLPRVIIDATHSIAEFPAVYSQTTLFIRRIITPLRIWNIFLST